MNIKILKVKKYNANVPFSFINKIAQYLCVFRLKHICKKFKILSRNYKNHCFYITEYHHIRKLWVKQQHIWETRCYGRWAGISISRIRYIRRSWGTQRCDLPAMRLNAQIFRFCGCIDLVIQWCLGSRESDARWAVHFLDWQHMSWRHHTGRQLHLTCYGFGLSRSSTGKKAYSC